MKIVIERNWENCKGKLRKTIAKLLSMLLYIAFYKTF